MKSPAEIQQIAKTLRGIPIWGVLPGSAAARAGVQSGDIVLRVNGIETPSFDDFLRARDAVKERFEIDVVRAGETLHLSVSLKTNDPSSSARMRAAERCAPASS